MYKMIVKIKTGLLMGIFVIAMLAGCQNAKSAEMIMPQLDDSTEVNEIKEKTNVFSETKVQKYNTDHGYKILYGEWLVEKKIVESYRLDIQDVSDVIGKNFIFSRQRAVFCYFNEEIEIEYPEYKITIIPLDEQTTYFPYLPTLKEMGITGSYVTIFSVIGYDIYFILKNDESIIMFYKDAYLELRRIGHIEGHDAFYNAL